MDEETLKINIILKPGAKNSYQNLILLLNFLVWIAASYSFLKESSKIALFS